MSHTTKSANFGRTKGEKTLRKITPKKPTYNVKRQYFLIASSLGCTISVTDKVLKRWQVAPQHIPHANGFQCKHSGAFPPPERPLISFRRNTVEYIYIISSSLSTAASAYGLLGAKSGFPEADISPRKTRHCPPKKDHRQQPYHHYPGGESHQGNCRDGQSSGRQVAQRWSVGAGSCSRSLGFKDYGERIVRFKEGSVWRLSGRADVGDFSPLWRSPYKHYPLSASQISHHPFLFFSLQEPAALPKFTGKEIQLMWKIKGAYLAAFPCFFCSSCLTQAPSITLRHILTLAVQISCLHSHPALCPGNSRSLIWKYG